MDLRSFPNWEEGRDVHLKILKGHVKVLPGKGQNVARKKADM